MKVIWTEPAKRELRDIFDFHSTVAGIATARKVVGKITSATLTLALNPFSGQCEELLEESPKNYRR